MASASWVALALLEPSLAAGSVPGGWWCCTSGSVMRWPRAKAARRRKRRMDRVEHDLTVEQWAALVEAWAGCAYCGASDRALQRDCVLALSRGGRYTLDNIVPACRSCNTSKCNHEVTTWMRRKRLDERSFLLRHAEIRAVLTLPAEREDSSGQVTSDQASGVPNRDVQIVRTAVGTPPTSNVIDCS